MLNLKLSATCRLTALFAIAVWPLASTPAPAQTSAADSSTNQVSKPAPAVAAPAFQRPAWMSELSVGIREGYDNNLLFVSGAGPMHPADSWVTTVSPKIGFNFIPFLGDQTILQALTFSYAPEFVTYHNEPVEPLGSHESYNAHKLASTIKGKADAFSFNMDNAFNYIDGSKEAPTYLKDKTGDDTQRSAYATAAPRERRNQYQDRSKITFQYDQDKWFARLSSALTYYELLTNQRTNAGYQNYADRYDVNGGADFGYKVTPQLAATLGYRYGHQYQQTFSRAIDPKQLSGNNDYQRVLLGMEGKPLSWLNVSLQGGPDFREYEGTRSNGTEIVHGMPVKDQNPVKYYGEAAITADISEKDSLVFKYKQWQWLSSTGKLPYFESTYDLSYRRKLTKQLTVDLGWRLATSDYTSAITGNGTTGLTGTSWQRDDWMYSVALGLTYAVTPNFSVNAGYAYDWGRNAQDNLAANQYEDNREFDHQLVALGAQFKF